MATWPLDPFWQGKTAAGEDVTVYAMEWRNPHPESQVRSLRITAGEPDAEVMLLVVAVTVVAHPDQQYRSRRSR